MSDSISASTGSEGSSVESSSPAQVAAQSQESITNESSNKEPNPNIRKIKIDGEEIDYDLGNEEQLVRDLQLSRAAQKRIQESSQIMKQAQQLVKALQNNPMAVLKHLGVNTQAQAEQYLYEVYKAEQEKIAYEQMDPEEKQRLDDARELQRLRQLEQERKEREENEQRTAKEKEQEARLEAAKAQATEAYVNQFQEALNSENIPINRFTLGRMAQLMKSALAKGINDVTPMDVIPLVKQEYEGISDQEYKRRREQELAKMKVSKPQSFADSKPSKDPNKPKFKDAHEQRAYLANLKL